MRELRNIKMKTHNLVCHDSENWPVHAKAFFEAIEHGPHFYCVCCLRSFFKEQVIGLTDNIKSKKVVLNGKNIMWFNDVQSINNNYYVCVNGKDE